MSDCTSNTWEGAAHGEEVILIITSISIISAISTIQDQSIGQSIDTGHNNHHYDRVLDQNHTHCATYSQKEKLASFTHPYGLIDILKEPLQQC